MIKKVIILGAIIFVFLSKIANAQNDTTSSMYILNKASLGIGIVNGNYNEVDNFFNEKAMLNKSTVHFCPEYQLIVGKILSSDKKGNHKIAIESGLILGANQADIETSSGSRYKLDQNYWGIPLSIQSIAFCSNKILKYGASITPKGSFYQRLREISPAAASRNIKSWNFFADGRVSLGLNAEIFFKRKKPGKFFGVGLQAERELNGNITSANDKIPFSMRNWRFSISIIPLVFFMR